MSGVNISPISLLGRVVSFNDQSFEQQIAQIAFPPDFPENLKSSLVTGQVTEFCLSVCMDGTASVCLLVNDNYYDLSEVKNLVTVWHGHNSVKRTRLSGDRVTVLSGAACTPSLKNILFKGWGKRSAPYPIPTLLLQLNYPYAINALRKITAKPKPFI